MLDLVDVLGERGAHFLVVVDHPVAHGVQHRGGPCERTLARCSRSRREPVQPAALAVAHGDDEVGATKSSISPVSTASCSSTYQRVLSDGEDRVVVVLDLGPLVRLEGVLDGQVVQVEGPATASISSADGSCSPTHWKSPGSRSAPTPTSRPPGGRAPPGTLR